jgi:hypothetical protein
LQQRLAKAPRAEAEAVEQNRADDAFRSGRTGWGGHLGPVPPGGCLQGRAYAGRRLL